MSTKNTIDLLQIDGQTIAMEQVVPLLTRSGMLPQFCREVIVEREIAKVSCTPEEITLAQEQLIKKHQLNTEKARQTWLSHYGLTTEQLVDIAVRELLVEKCKYATWGSKVEAHFLTQKSKLDKVIYSLLRTPHQEIATELYFRIEAGEQSFAELAREYSTGPEARTGGLVGPVELSKPHPTLAKMLSVSQPGQLHSPIQLGEWFVILRLENFIPAVLNDTLRQQLIDNLWSNWLQEQVQQAMREMVKGLRENSQPLSLDPYPLTNSKTDLPAVLEAV